MIFYINLPLGAVALIVTSVVLRLPRPHARPRVDYLGMTLLGGAVACLVLLISWGGTTYASASPVITGLGGAVLRFPRPGWCRPATRQTQSSRSGCSATRPSASPARSR